MNIIYYYMVSSIPWQDRVDQLEGQAKDAEMRWLIKGRKGQDELWFTNDLMGFIWDSMGLTHDLMGFNGINS